MKAEGENDHKNFELNVNLTFVTPPAVTKAEQDEMMSVSSSDESIASKNFSVLSGVSTNPSESYSVTGTKGSPCMVYSDSESMCSDNEDCEKIIYNDFEEDNTLSTSDNESEKVKQGNYGLKYTGHNNYDSPLNEEVKRTVGQEHDLNLLETESPIKLNFLEKEYVPNSNAHTVKSLESSQNLSRKNDLRENKGSDGNQKLLLSEKLDSNRFQTCSSQLFSTSQMENTSSQGACASSSKYFVSSDREAITSKWNKPIEDDQIKTPNNDTTITSLNKDTLLPTSLRLKNKAKLLSLIYTEFKNEMPQNDFLKKISKLSNSSSDHLLPFKNLEKDDDHLKDTNTASGETNKVKNPLTISHTQKKITDPLMANSDKHTSSDNGSSVTKLHDKLDSVSEGISGNFCSKEKLPRLNMFSISDDSFNSQDSKIPNLEFVGKETGFGDNIQGSPINAFIPNQEIKQSFSNNVGGNNSQISSLCTGTSNDTDLIYCDYCKKHFFSSTHNKMAEAEKETTCEMEKEFLNDSEVPGVDIFLQIFNTDNVLAKNILLAVSSKELTNRATYTNVVKYLRKKKFSSTKLLKDVRAFLQASVNAQILKLKGNRYILSEVISSAKAKRTQNIKKKEVKKTAKKRKSKSNGEKNTRKMLTPTSKRVARKSRTHENSSKATGNQVVKKKFKMKAKAKSNVLKLSEGKKINQGKKKVETEVLKKILIRKDIKRKFEK